MSEPLNTYTIKHYLNFKSRSEGVFQIDEPIGFDAANFKLDQEDKRYGRDISFGGSYEFVTGFNPLGHKFNLLLEYDRDFGYESEVDYILEAYGIEYVVGQLDFKNRETDEILYFSCDVIQSKSQATIKRREDIDVNLFDTEDLDGGIINPVETINLLLKAKPTFEVSEWFMPSQISFLSLNSFNPINGIQKSQINSTLNWLPFANREDCKLIQAQSNLTNVQIDITEISFTTSVQSPPSPGNVSLYYRFGNDFNSSDQILLRNFNDDAIDESISLNIPFISNGQSLWIYFEAENQPPIFVISFTGGKTKITATSTFINSVTKGVRLRDAHSKVVESINSDYNVSQPRFDDEWFDNVVFSGNMLRGIDRFTLKWKDIVGALSEFHSDYEINENELFIGKYDDFYKNTEIGAFLIKPNADFLTTYNERYAINEFNFKYKSYNQDRDDQNTIDALHTETQYLLPNKLVENTKSVECDFVRDPFLIESTRRKAFSEDTASVQEDDEVFILDIVPLAPNSTSGFTALLNHQWNTDNGQLKLLNDGSFSWLLLGFGLGDSFSITQFNSSSISANQGNYTVSAIERTLITLDISDTNLNPQNGEFVTSVIYPLTNVAYTNRTNEGFDSIEGLVEGEDYSNLIYTPKRNIINNYGSYLATSTQYKKDTIKNTYYKNWTGDVVLTSFEGDSVNETGNVDQNELSDPILTPKVITTKVLCDFSQYIEFQNKIRSERGFVRIYNNNDRVLKGYARKSEFEWAKNELTIELEEKFESDTITITYSANVYTINEVGYPEDILSEIQIKAEGDYVQLFDDAARPLINKTRFEKISVNGTFYDSIVDLAEALS